MGDGLFSHCKTQNVDIGDVLKSEDSYVKQKQAREQRAHDIFNQEQNIKDTDVRIQATGILYGQPGNKTALDNYCSTV